jgi:hypothetical protein
MQIDIDILIYHTIFAADSWNGSKLNSLFFIRRSNQANQQMFNDV